MVLNDISLELNLDIHSMGDEFSIKRGRRAVG